MDTAKKKTKKQKKTPGRYAAKTPSKRVVQKTAKVTGDLVGNKIVDKITILGKTKSEEK